MAQDQQLGEPRGQTAAGWEDSLPRQATGQAGRNAPATQGRRRSVQATENGPAGLPTGHQLNRRPAQSRRRLPKLAGAPRGVSAASETRPARLPSVRRSGGATRPPGRLSGAQERPRRTKNNRRADGAARLVLQTPPATTPPLRPRRTLPRPFHRPTPRSPLLAAAARLADPCLPCPRSPPGPPPTHPSALPSARCSPPPSFPPAPPLLVFSITPHPSIHSFVPSALTCFLLPRCRSPEPPSLHRSVLTGC